RRVDTRSAIQRVRSAATDQRVVAATPGEVVGVRGGGTLYSVRVGIAYHCLIAADDHVLDRAEGAPDGAAEEELTRSQVDGTPGQVLVGGGECIGTGSTVELI